MPKEMEKGTRARAESCYYGHQDGVEKLVNEDEDTKIGKCKVCKICEVQGMIARIKVGHEKLRLGCGYGLLWLSGEEKRRWEGKAGIAQLVLLCEYGLYKKSCVEKGKKNIKL